MIDIIANIVGICGIALMLIAYFLLTSGRVEESNKNYLLLNAGGAFLIILSLLQNFNLPSFIIEVCWFFISIYGLIKNAKPKGGEEKSGKFHSPK